MCKNGLTLSPILCDGMILQRDTYNRIYGFDTDAASITVCFMDFEYYVKVDENHDFSMEIPPVAAGGPYSLTVKGSSEITISDILFGDVYILSGQSNMELPIRRVLDVSENEIENSCEPAIRQYLIPATYDFKEPKQYMFEGSWKKAVGEDLMNFSAAGFFFAKEIKDIYQIPIGLIMTAVGGCCIEAWMNPGTLNRFGNYVELVDPFKNTDYFKAYLQKQQDAADEWDSRMEEEEQIFIDTEDFTRWNTCMVPSLVSDYTAGDFQGSVYLCRNVYLKEEPEIEDAYIYMGSIIDSDQIWINGEIVGKTEYRYPPRKYKFTKSILKSGNNLITVRIVINGRNGGTIKGKPYRLHYNGQDINLEGVWYYRIGKRAETPRPEVLFPPSLPICFYNTVVVPLSKISVKGVLWYQGETNTNAPQNYAEKFAAMLSDWRELSGWELPFICVQLPNYREPLNSTEDSGWAELREQQRRCLSILNVALVTALDIGEGNDLHPQNKKELGIRLAKAARYLIYNEAVDYCGPVPLNAVPVGKMAEIVFKCLEDVDKECTINNFELAGSDGIYYKALALRRGKRVFVSSDKVECPKYIRYAWCDSPSDINFFNDAGLPAAGFRMEL